MRGAINPTLSTPRLNDWPSRLLHLAQPCDIMQSNLVHPEAAILFVHISPQKPNALQSCSCLRASIGAERRCEVTADPT